MQLDTVKVEPLLVEVSFTLFQATPVHTLRSATSPN